MRLQELVIDALIPHEPDVITCARQICGTDSVEQVTISVMEVDDRTKKLEILIAGESLSMKDIEKTIEDIGGSIHSVDRVRVAV